MIQEDQEAFYQFNCAACGIKHKRGDIPSYAHRDKYRAGITVAAIISILQFQKGRCAICSIPICLLNTKQWAVDHDHSCCKPGNNCQLCVRGILCGLCNRMLGLSRDSQTILRRGATYLHKWRHRRYNKKSALRPIKIVAVEFLVGLRKKGATLAEIAERFHCTEMTVLRKLRRGNLQAK